MSNLCALATQSVYWTFIDSIAYRMNARHVRHILTWWYVWVRTCCTYAFLWWHSLVTGKLSYRTCWLSHEISSLNIRPTCLFSPASEATPYISVPSGQRGEGEGFCKQIMMCLTVSWHSQLWLRHLCAFSLGHNIIPSLYWSNVCSYRIPDRAIPAFPLRTGVVEC